MTEVESSHPKTKRKDAKRKKKTPRSEDIDADALWDKTQSLSHEGNERVSEQCGASE